MAYWVPTDCDCCKRYTAYKLAGKEYRQQGTGSAYVKCDACRLGCPPILNGRARCADTKDAADRRRRRMI